MKAPTWLLRLLNRLHLRSDAMICMHRDDTHTWGGHLGERTEGECCLCHGPIYFEKQNAPFRKVCNRCAYPIVWTRIS